MLFPNRCRISFPCCPRLHVFPRTSATRRAQNIALHRMDKDEQEASRYFAMMADATHKVCPEDFRDEANEWLREHPLPQP